jgi:hypothetical protein
VTDRYDARPRFMSPHHLQMSPASQHTGTETSESGSRLRPTSVAGESLPSEPFLRYKVSS